MIMDEVPVSGVGFDAFIIWLILLTPNVQVKRIGHIYQHVG